MKNRIIIFDNVIIGNNHLVINASIIDIAQNFFEGESLEILCFGDKSHMSLLSNLITQNKNCKVLFNPIEVIHPERGKIKKIISWIKKLEIDRKHFNELINLCNVKHPKLVMVNTLIPLNLFRFTKILNNEKNQNFLIFLHGELEYIFKNNISFNQKIKAYFIKKALKNASSNIKFIVFSDYIKKTLIEHFHFEDNRVISINHPILKYVRCNNEISKCVTFSHFGVANRRKNSSLIFKLADHMVSSIENMKCRFSIIGRVDGKEIDYISNNVIIESKGNKPIDNDKYIDLISNSDYSLIFLTEDEYIHRISGSLLDSVQFQTPIIALKHISTIELFEKGGDIGFLCDDFDEMQEVVNQITRKNYEYIGKYKRQVSNLIKLSKKFHSDNASFIINKNLDCW